MARQRNAGRNRPHHAPAYKSLRAGSRARLRGALECINLLILLISLKS
jgi:hypothetical protein